MQHLTSQESDAKQQFNEEMKIRVDYFTEKKHKYCIGFIHTLQTAPDRPNFHNVAPGRFYTRYHSYMQK